VSNKSFKKIACAGGIIIAFSLTASLSCLAAEKAGHGEKAAVVIGVIPFQAMIPQEPGSMVICPLCTTGHAAGRIADGAEKIVEDIFVEKLGEFKNIIIIPQERVAGVYKRISAESLRRPLFDVLKKAANELGADVLALGYIYRYIDRVGYGYSAKKPASVAFEIYMISPREGEIIWRGVFDKTQKSLMEDLFQISSFFKGGGKWLTAEELSKQGMAEIFKKFPGFTL